MGPVEWISGRWLGEWWFRLRYRRWCDHPPGSVRFSAVSRVAMCFDCGRMVWHPHSLWR